MDLICDLKELEEKLLQYSDNACKLQTLRVEFQNFHQSILAGLDKGILTGNDLSKLSKQVARIKHIANFFAALENDNSTIVTAAVEDSRRLVEEESLQSKAPSISDIAAITTNSFQESLNSKLLRQWFLENLSDPFPDRETKESLVWKTNALLEAASPQKESKSSLSSQPIDVQQCALWFINSRRRSQWTSLFRQFANSDKQTMRYLMDCLLAEEDVARPGPNSTLEAILERNAKGVKRNSADLAKRVEDCREMFSTLMEWIRQKPKEKIGDWMDEVIQEAKMELKEEKQARREERKRAIGLQDGKGETHKKQKRKIDDEDEEDEAEDARVDRRRSGRIVKRKFVELERGAHTSPAICDTPLSNHTTTVFGDSSVGSSSWSSSGSSRLVPSLFESNDSQPKTVSNSSSTSSLASYDAYHRAPGSPTLSILKNTQAQSFNQNSLYMSQPYGQEQTRFIDPYSFQQSHSWPSGAQTNLSVLPGTELDGSEVIPMRELI